MLTQLYPTSITKIIVSKQIWAREIGKYRAIFFVRLDFWQLTPNEFPPLRKINNESTFHGAISFICGLLANHINELLKILKGGRFHNKHHRHSDLQMNSFFS